MALWVGVGVVGVLAAASTAVAVVRAREAAPTTPPPSTAALGACARTVRVVTASSFAPVLERLAPALSSGADCLGLETSVVDGRPAAARVAEREADVWIPDDVSWTAVARKGLLAEDGSGGAGTVLATSPIYMVADRATAGRVTAAGGSWLGLAKLLDRPQPAVRLAVRDPNSSGDGMVAAGSLGESVWLDRGMDASAMALATALSATRTVTGAPALPGRGEVGLVPEYALLSRPDATTGRVLLPGTDHTALLRFSWQPTTMAMEAPERAAALGTLFAALKRDAGPALAAAHLRGPTAAVPAGVQGMPALTAKPFKILGGHHVDHVFASWYVQDRKGSLLLVLDVSGSMAEVAPGSRARLIDLVRQGCLAVGRLLPDASALGLWEFGSELAPPADYRSLLPTAALAPAHRAALLAAVGRLQPRTTGTGLYDTTLAAYRSAVASYRPGMPNQVFIFTDGRNEDDPDSITAAQLTAGLQAAADPERPVQLSVVAYGSRPEVPTLEKAIEPVHGYLSKVTTAEEVAAAFVHVAAAGLH
ncbi:MAG TPA: substrate-binding domain-containing protein [Mycobacteriales bacterium]